MDIRALFRVERRETAGHTWQPRPADSLTIPAPANRTTFASPTEYARLRSGMASEGADEDWLAWVLDDEEEQSEVA